MAPQLTIWAEEASYVQCVKLHTEAVVKAGRRRGRRRTLNGSKRTKTLKKGGKPLSASSSLFLLLAVHKLLSHSLFAHHGTPEIWQSTASCELRKVVVAVLFLRLCKSIVDEVFFSYMSLNENCFPDCLLLLLPSCKRT